MAVLRPEHPGARLPPSRRLPARHPRRVRRRLHPPTEHPVVERPAHRHPSGATTETRTRTSTLSELMVTQDVRGTGAAQLIHGELPRDRAVIMHARTAPRGLSPAPSPTLTADRYLTREGHAAARSVGAGRRSPILANRVSVRSSGGGELAQRRHVADCFARRPQPCHDDGRCRQHGDGGLRRCGGEE